MKREPLIFRWLVPGLVITGPAGRVMSANPKDTPEDISHTSEGTAFLPSDRMDPSAAFTRCHATLKDKLGAAGNSAAGAGKCSLYCWERELNNGG